MRWRELGDSRVECRELKDSNLRQKDHGDSKLRWRELTDSKLGRIELGDSRLEWRKVGNSKFGEREFGSSRLQIMTKFQLVRWDSMIQCFERLQDEMESSSSPGREGGSG